MTPQGQSATSALQALVGNGTLTGSWILDPARSEVRLATRHTWGLRPLHGVFRQFTGNGTVTAGGQVTGTLTVAAGSIDTRNKMRDKDLRSAKVFDIAATAERTMFESARFGTGSFTADDVDTTIEPPPRAFIDGTARRTMRTALRTSSSNAPCHAASSNESVVPAGGPPAFTNKRSTPPNFSIVRACHAASESADFTSKAVPSVSTCVSLAMRCAASAIACS